MRKLFRKAATSLALNLMVALVARVAFLWNQQRKFPAGDESASSETTVQRKFSWPRKCAAVLSGRYNAER